MTSQFWASVARRDQVVKKTCVGAVPRTSRGDRLGVLEVGSQRRDSLVETLRVTAQTRDLPPVGKEALGDIASADARDADDERASTHRRPLSARDPLRRTWL